MPIPDRLAFRDGAKRGVDSVAGAERSFDNRVFVGRRVELGDIVLTIDRVPRANRIACRRARLWIVIVGKRDRRSEGVAGKPCECRGQSAGIIGQNRPAVGEVGDDQFNHERFKTKIVRVVLLLEFAPEFQQSDNLGEMFVARFFTLSYEIEVHRHARHQLLARFLGNQVPAPCGVAGIKNRNDIYLVPCRYEVDADRVRFALDLLRLEVGERLLKFLGQPFDQFGDGAWGSVGGDIARNVDIADGLQRRALGETARQHHLAKFEIRVIGEVALQLVAQTVGLIAKLGCVFALQVHAFVCKTYDITMIYVVSAHGAPSFGWRVESAIANVSDMHIMAALTTRQVYYVESAMPRETKPSEIFPERLKAARDLRDWNQSELARRSGLPASSIAHFEAGARKPSFDNLRRLATALEVTTDFLLGRVDHPTLAADADPIFRDAGKLSGGDRDLAKDFLKMLAERKPTKR